MPNFQEILINEFDDFIDKVNPTFNQLKSLYHIKMCHTDELGYNSYSCSECDYTEIHYNSCRDRNCPMCQYHKREEWINNYSSYLLDVPYFHVVFTLPEELNPIIYQNQSIAYNIIFKTASQSLLQLGKEYLGTLGFTTILHTWGQNLSFHPHLHCIVCGGALDKNEDNETVFNKAKNNYLLPVKQLSKLFRGKFLSAFKKTKFNHVNHCVKYNNPEEFNALLSSLYNKEWVVYTKKPFGNNHAVLEYIGRYSHRIAISNNRILGYDKDMHTVTFSYKDYKDKSKKKEMTLNAVEFLRRFSMHILPPRFMKIRHYGFMSNNTRSSAIAICKKILNQNTDSCVSAQNIHQATQPFEYRCPHCGKSLNLKHKVTPFTRMNSS